MYYNIPGSSVYNFPRGISRNSEFLIFVTENFKLKKNIFLKFVQNAQENVVFPIISTAREQDLLQTVTVKIIVKTIHLFQRLLFFLSKWCHSLSP
jgi:hypothetical protein